MTFNPGTSYLVGPADIGNPRIGRVGPNKRTKSVIHPPERSVVGINRYGSCLSCGTELNYWFTYKYCDRCLIIPTGAVTHSKGYAS